MNTLVIRDIGLLELLDSHAGGRVVWTPQVEQLGLAIAEWMMLGLPGGAAYGQQRCGKIDGFDFSEANNERVCECSDNGLFLWNIGESLRPVPEPTLLRGFLSETGYMLTSHKDRSVLMTRLVHFIVQNCEAEAARRALILVDEAQNIHFFRIMACLLSCLIY
ncbi:hypothetical protein ACFS07_20105 [Undibacterium arcticum]